MKALLILALSGVFVLAGCFGGGADVQQNVSSVSKGQELTDLQRALDDGAITQPEYDRLRRKMMSAK